MTKKSNKISLTSTLGLKKLEVEKKVVELDEGIELEVMTYIPVRMKNAIINDTLAISYVNGMFHPVILDAVFHAILVEQVTNISYTKGQQENIVDTFDLLQYHGIIAEVSTALGSEYDMLVEDLMSVLHKSEGKQRSLTEQVTDLVVKATEAINVLSDLEPENAEIVRQLISDRFNLKLDEPKQ